MVNSKSVLVAQVLAEVGLVEHDDSCWVETAALFSRERGGAKALQAQQNRRACEVCAR
jgi:hypothetical protein